MRLPEKDSTGQLIISLMVGLGGMVALLIAEAKHRQTLEMLKEVKQTVKEVCK